MAVKKETVEQTPLGTLEEHGRKDKAPPEQKGYHGSQDDVKTPAELEREQAEALEQKQRGVPDSDDADVTIKVTKD